MNIWHDTPDAPRTPRRVSPTETVELTIGTWPIGPGQSARRSIPCGSWGHNPLRTETAAAAAEIDARIAQAWASHSRRFIVESSSDFLDKAARGLAILRGELPG